MIVRSPGNLHSSCTWNAGPSRGLFRMVQDAMLDSICWRVILTTMSARFAASPLQTSSLVWVPTIGKSSSPKAGSRAATSTATTAPPRAMVLSTMLLLSPGRPPTETQKQPKKVLGSSRGAAPGQPPRPCLAQLPQPCCGKLAPVTEPAAPTYLFLGPQMASRLCHHRGSPPLWYDRRRTC